MSGPDPIAEAFAPRDGELCCEQVPLSRVAAQAGTPAYLYSSAALRGAYRALDGAFGGMPHLVCYSLKACWNLAVLRVLVREGAGIDVTSGGELYRALRAGADPSRIVYSGVGKRDDEIAYALGEGILLINAESEGELRAIARVAGAIGVTAPVALRVNPDVDPHTHPYIATGLRENKFGIPSSRAHNVWAEARALSHLAVRGLGCHIGSQLLDPAPYRVAVAQLAELARDLAAGGARLTHLDVGGGFGIRYRPSDAPPDAAAFRAAIEQALAPVAGMGLTVVSEPGRFIAGNAGALLARVIDVKRGEDKTFVVTDAGMNDLIRPALYHAHHEIRAVRPRPGEPIVADVVGPVCESSDFFALGRALPPLAPGDLVAVLSAGAYGFTMASNYNGRPRPAEVLVDGDRFAVVRERETYEDLIRGETVPAWA